MWSQPVKFKCICHVSIHMTFRQSASIMEMEHLNWFFFKKGNFIFFSSSLNILFNIPAG